MVFISVWPVLKSLSQTGAWRARASLMAIAPVLIIPVVVLLRRERVGAEGVLGVLLAVAGVVLLFL